MSPPIPSEVPDQCKVWYNCPFETNGTTYTNAPTCDVRRVPRCFTSLKFSFETWIGPLEGYIYQISWRICVNAHPDCINSGTIYLSVVSLTLGVLLSYFYNRFKIRRVQKCAWGTTAMWERLSISLNIRTKSTTGRRMLKPYCTLCCIYPLMNPTTSGANYDAWGPLLIEFFRESLDQRRPVWTGIPSSM